MKINGYEFTEEDKKTYIDFLGLCGRIWQENSESELCLETGSSDYTYPVGFKTIKIDEIGSHNDLILEPEKY